MSVAALAILGPLTAAILILLARRTMAALALLGAGIGLGAAVVTLVRVGGGARFAATLAGLPDLPLRLAVDPLAAILSTTVAVVSVLVLIYAVGYMHAEEGQARFYAGMAFFTAAMQAVVLAGDWLLFLAAWELIGFSSYVLIGFWFERPGVASAATRAFLTTRAADLGLYSAIFVLTTQAGTTAMGATLHVGGTAALVASLLLLVAAMGKAAQIPFQGWLQEAMRGPTPVSALLHSATLVAAGAVLLTRAFPLLPSSMLPLIGIVGGSTTLVTGVMALAQADLKRLLAASTSSQLGFVFLALGAASLGAAIVHLVAHAAMKSALFLASGIFQEAYNSTSFDDLAGAGRMDRLTFWGFTIAGLALAGIPPLAGFWSKGTIVAATFASPNAPLLGALALAGTLLTGAYIGRAVRLLWQGQGRTRRTPLGGTMWMGAGLAGLVLLAVLLGLAVSPIGAILGTRLPQDTMSAVLDLVAAIAGLLAGGALPSLHIPDPIRLAARTGFRIDGGVDGLVVRPALALARVANQTDQTIHQGILAIGRVSLDVARVTRWSDDQGIDGLIAALVRTVRALGGRARHLQTGLVSGELVLTISGAALVVALVLATT